MRAKTNSERRISYEPDRRPEVANLLRIAALCQQRRAEELADEIGDKGAAALKNVVAETVNERLRPIRARRAELVRDPAYLRSVLREGNKRTSEIAEAH